MTPTASTILLLVLVLGARQNLRNDDNIVITADDVQGYYPLSVVDDCIWDLIEYGGYVDCNQYPIIDYYEHRVMQYTYSRHTCKHCTTILLSSGILMHRMRIWRIG